MSTDKSTPLDTGPQLVLIAGPSGSGKSTLARSLGEHFGEHAGVIHFDDFQYDAEMLTADEDGYRNWDDPKFTDFDHAYSSLCKLLQGKSINLMAKNEYDNPEYIKGTYVRKPIAISPRRLYIVEGHYALVDDRIVSLATLTIYLSVDFDVSAARRTKLSDKVYDERYLRPMFEEVINPTESKADIVLAADRLSREDVYTNTIELVEALL